jgi:hypothetical protein
MSVPSVNPETPPVADSESQDTQWIDPMFRDQDDPLPDEPASDEEAAEAAEGDKGDAGPTAEQLAELVAKDTEAPESDNAAPKAQAEPAPGGDEDGGDAGSEAADLADDEDKEYEPKKTKPRRRSQSRRERREQGRAIQTLQEQLAGLQAQLRERAPAAEAEAAAKAEEVPAEPPTLEDHDFDNEKWATAMGKWTKDTVAANETKAETKAEQARQEAANRAAAERQAETMETFGEREEAARELHKDYDDVVYDLSLAIDPRAAQAIWQSEQGPGLAYYLATHQDESKAMFDMIDVDLGRALAKIEFTLTAEQAAPAAKPEDNTAAAAAEQAPADKPGQQAKPVPTPTSAPPPVPTLGGSGAAMRPSPEKMSMDEYIAGRRSGKIK